MGALLCMAAAACADTWYVATNSLSDGPGTTWSNAFHTIQSGVDVATNAGDVVLVTNGTYYLSSAVLSGGDITIESTGGAEVTIADGQNGTRCFDLGGGMQKGRRQKGQPGMAIT